MSEAIKAFYERKYTQGAEIARTSKEYTLDCVPDGQGLGILDVGCGSGANSVILADKGYKVYGCRCIGRGDCPISSAWLQRARH